MGKKHIWLGLIIALVAFLVYVPTLAFELSPMDDKWVLRDFEPYFKKWAYLPSLFTVPLFAMYYRPLFLVALMVDQLLGNGAPWMFHLSNCLFHAGSCLMLFQVLLLLKVPQKQAFCWTLLFALHPMQVHAVAWVPGRNDTLFGLFTLSSVYFLLRLLNGDQNHQRRWLTVAHLTSFILALFTKENAIVLPAVFGAIWIANKQGEAKKWLLAYFGIGLVWFLLRLYVVDFFPTAAKSALTAHVLKWAFALWLYLGKAIVPYYQAIMPLAANTPWWPSAVATLLVILLFLLRRIEHQFLFLVGLCWFFLFLAIPIWAGVNGNGEHYEHRLYLPLMGMALAGAQLRRFERPALGWALFAVVLAAFAFRVVDRCKVYENEYTFAHTAAQESPSIALLQNMLGVAYEKKGDLLAAQAAFERATQLRANTLFYANLGAIFTLENEPLRAIDSYSKAIALNPKNGDNYLRRSELYLSLSAIDSAAADLQNAAKYHAQGITQGYANKVNHLFQTNIVKVYTAKIEAQPKQASLLNIRGVAYLNLGQWAAALKDLDAAIALDPDNKEYQYNRNVLYAKTGNKAKK